MTGVRLLLLSAVLLGGHALVSGQEIAELQGRVDAQLAEIASLESALSEHELAATRFDTDLARLRAATDALKQRKAQALDAMKAQFERLIADPNLALSSAQTSYRDALGALQDHDNAIQAKQTEIATTRQQIQRLAADAEAARRQLAQLRAGFDVARAERLYRELNVEGSLQIDNTITCERDETIAACAKRGSDAALQAAKRRFSERVFASATEAQLIAEHRGKATFEATVVDSKITKSGFSGQGDYYVAFEARLRSAPSQAQACALLGLTPAQCSGARTAADSPPGNTPSADTATASAPADTAPADDADSAQEPVAMADGNHLLTVRSNVYYDEVFIDGISYGSTRLDVILPEGEYDVEVRKPDHDSFRQRVRLDRNRTISASLSEQND